MAVPTRLWVKYPMSQLKKASPCEEAFTLYIKHLKLIDATVALDPEGP